MTATTSSVLNNIFNVADTIASMLPAGSEVVDAIKLAVTIGNGLANALPAIEALWSEIQAAAAGQVAPTEAQWAAWNAAADTAHQEWLAAIGQA